MRVVALTWSAVAGVVLLAHPLAAQTKPVVTGAEIDAALEARATSAAADRATVLKTLDHPEVARVAEEAGVDLDAARGTVDALDDAQLARAAQLSRDIDQALAGGQVFSINAMTLILVLLLVILVILIAD